MGKIDITLHAGDFSGGGVSPSAVTDGSATVPNLTWAKLLHAACTVGKPSNPFLRTHRNFSLFDWIFRWSLIQAHLEVASTKRIVRSGVLKSLEPTEKVAVAYFLGMALTKLIADEKLGIPALIHMHTFTKGKNVTPDLLGESFGPHTRHEWFCFEAKGSTNRSEKRQMNEALYQLGKGTLIRKGVPLPGKAVPNVVDGTGSPIKFVAGVASASCFSGPQDVLEVHWRDPELRYDREGRKVVISDDNFWMSYYGRIFNLFEGRHVTYMDHHGANEPIATIQLGDGGMKVGVLQSLYNLRDKSGEALKGVVSIHAERTYSERTAAVDAQSKTEATADNSYLGSDGVYIELLPFRKMKEVMNDASPM